MARMNERHMESSPYRQLYKTIDKMLAQGKILGNNDAIRLATQLKRGLKTFEVGPNNKSSVTKAKFRQSFIHDLHSMDKIFSIQNKGILTFVRAIHISFYTSVYSAGPNISSSSLFGQKGTDKVMDPLKPRAS